MLTMTWTVAVAACLSIGATAIADSRSLGDQTRQCPGVHTRLHIDRQLGATVHAMWHRSPTSRRQMGRLSQEPDLDTRLTIWTTAPYGDTRAETVLRRVRGGLRMATIRVKLPNDEETIVELIAHELEHIVEQLAGVNLQLSVDRYGTGRGIRGGPVGRSETERAQRVGLAVRAWQDAAVARQPETALPANLDVDPMFQVVVEGMRQRSPAFRRQIARIGAAQMFRVRVLPADRVRPTSGADATAVFAFNRGVLVSAHLSLRMAAPELIAHEMEHIVEQLDGIDLRAQSGNGVVWKSHDGSFETRRAIEAGLLVAQEVARGGARVTREAGTAAYGAPLSIVQRERDTALSSDRTARISANGRFVALTSPARLVERDRNDRRDVYVFDGETGLLSLESLGHLGEPADGESSALDISADGRFVVFAAEAGNLTAASFAPGRSHVFLRDRLEGTTRLLTVGTSGDPANGPSRSPVIDEAGTSVAFESAATDLAAPGLGNGIFLVSVVSGEMTRVDETADGGSRRGASMSPSISADGHYVAFASRAELTCIGRSRCHEDNGVADVYVRDTRANTTRRISRGVAGGESNGASYDPAISGDGRYVAFVSEASNLTDDAVGRGAQIYVHDLLSGATELISRTRAGRPGNGRSLRPAMSHDGQRIAYQSLASDLLCDHTCKAGQADINLLWDVFLHDRRTGQTVRASRDGGGDWMEYSRAPSLDGRGHVVVFVTRHPIADADVGYDEDLLIQDWRQ